MKLFGILRFIISDIAPFVIYIDGKSIIVMQRSHHKILKDRNDSKYEKISDKQGVNKQNSFFHV